MCPVDLVVEAQAAALAEELGCSSGREVEWSVFGAGSESGRGGGSGDMRCVPPGRRRAAAPT